MRAFLQHARYRAATVVSSPPSHDAGATAAQQRWDGTLRPLLANDSEALWRAHVDAVHAALFSRWLPASGALRVLKTDLFDEAMGAGLYPLLAARAQEVVGLDFASSVIAAAAARHPGLSPVAADVRRLPFARASFDVIVSNSTLDHFETRDEIGIALRELHRVLRPDGRLLLTLDNLANPVVALRNALPYRLLQRLGLVPYPVGATCRPRQLRLMLEAQGFEPCATAAVLHCPRVLAVAVARRLQRFASPRMQRRFLTSLQAWERLAGLPTRFVTGYFIAISARKR